MDFSMFTSRSTNLPFPDDQKACGCEQPDIVTDYAAGEEICRSCCLVLSHHLIDQSPEWNSGGGEDGKDNSRVGAPVNFLLPNSALSTMITVPWKRKTQCRLMEKLHLQGGMEYKERALFHTFKAMEDTLSNVMKLPKAVIVLAMEIYKSLKEMKLTRGENHKCLIAASVYYACKIQNQHGVSRSQKEIIDIFQLDEKHFNEVLKFSRNLLRDKKYFHLLNTELKPSDLIMRNITWIPFADNRQKWRCVGRIVELEKQMQEVELLSGKHAKSILAGIIHVVCTAEKVGILGKDVCAALEISPATLHKISKIILKFITK